MLELKIRAYNACEHANGNISTVAIMQANKSTRVEYLTPHQLSAFEYIKEDSVWLAEYLSPHPLPTSHGMTDTKCQKQEANLSMHSTNDGMFHKQMDMHEYKGAKNEHNGEYYTQPFRMSVTQFAHFRYPVLLS